MCENIRLMCVVCRIGVYSLCRRMCCMGPPSIRPNFTVLCLGLTKAGKSSLLAVLSGDDIHKIEPTIGFSIKAIMFDNCILDVKELGGGDSVRPYWDRYYQETQGVIFVLNGAGSNEELDKVKEEFHKALDDPQLESHPLLVLVNYNDVPGARTTDEISKLLDLEKETAKRKWMIQSCSVNDKESIMSAFDKYNILLVDRTKEDGKDFDQI
ncbi:hypothetical protein LOTGIDRAFT_227454 [Lottia gigantea]|uniref:ADP-ribosylation factor-like protein 15 n=1 Tax=Lottia gigantea TaxID=225164 RepID=V4BVB7_LOTGI|nr:hypothetical protein LOTGIDRAFT_227454 [Lottia gigantea]ESO92954.1 hypothetical protein LOTGIDRAFT_227454 [Lottia gigantea]